MKRTKFLIVYAALTTGAIGLTGCSDETKDVIVRAEQLTMDNFSTGYITAVEKDRGVTWKWDLLPENMQMDITVLRENLPYTHELTRATSIEQKDMETNVRYDYLFRLYDGTRYSDAILKTYTRQGATILTGLTVCQQEGADGYEALLTWDMPFDATQILLEGVAGSKTISETLDGKTDHHLVKGIAEGDEWTFTLTARNDKGDALPVTTTLKAGRQKAAFLSYYPTPDQLVARGDDDEASAWLWFHETYPHGRRPGRPASNLLYPRPRHRFQERRVEPTTSD